MKKRIISFILIILIIFSINTLAYAEDTSKINIPQAPMGEITPYGNNFPTTSKSLPYYSVASTIYKFVYTNAKFKPINNKIVTSLSFTTQGSGSCTVTVSLYKSTGTNSATLIDSYSVNGAFVKYNTHTWSGLSSNSYYFVKISKNKTSDKAVVKIGCGATSSSASDYTFNYASV